MGRKPADVTDAEFAVLDALWAAGRGTIRALTDRLYPDGGTPAYSTVQKLLHRLEGKGWVERERTGTAHVYAPRADRETLVASRLQQTADQICGGSLRPLLTALLSHPHLSREEIAELRRWVDSFEEHAPRDDVDRETP